MILVPGPAPATCHFHATQDDRGHESHSPQALPHTPGGEWSPVPPRLVCVSATAESWALLASAWPGGGDQPAHPRPHLPRHHAAQQRPTPLAPRLAARGCGSFKLGKYCIKLTSAMTPPETGVVAAPVSVLRAPPAPLAPPALTCWSSCSPPPLRLGKRLGKSLKSRFKDDEERGAALLGSSTNM